MHYLPEVQSVRQVMDDEEIALKEFEKLEAKLAQTKHNTEGTDDARV
jgi:hypothetical protein